MPAAAVERAWREQSVWSQAANRLKRELGQNRFYALVLAVVGAVLSAAAVSVGVGSAAGRALAAMSALAVGLGGLARSRIGRGAVRDWTRTRSVSEAIKSEVYLYLAALGDYGVNGRDARLDERITGIEEDASDLLRFRSGVEPAERPLPPVSDIDSYMRVRVGGQIEDYYRPQARALESRIRLVRRIEAALAVAGVVFGALGGALELDAVAVWVPVVTTVGAAITAHAAAARYEYLLVEYLRTAEELERLRDRRGSAGTLSNEELVKQAEHVISVQNEGWMAKLTSPEGAPTGD
jgi:hypothetical protein